jgi:uncharacterized protein
MPARFGAIELDEQPRVDARKRSAKRRLAGMSNNPNDLAEDFPGQAERIHELKRNNGRFARLYDEYDELSRTIHRIETRVEPAAAEVEDDLKRRRVHLKDEIATLLANGKD